jgi:hypothetical protein
VDSSGNGLTGSLEANRTSRLPEWTAAGKLDSCLTFRDTSSQAVQIDDNALLDPVSGITVSAWIYPTEFNSGANPRVLQKGEGDNQYRLLVEGGDFKFDVSGVGTLTYGNLPALNS